MFWKYLFRLNSIFYTGCAVSLLLGWVPPLSLAESAAFFGAAIGCLLYSER